MEWQAVGYIPQGPKGDRLFLFAERQPTDHFANLYGQLQTWNVASGEYENQGEAELLTTLFDGQVQVGFWLPSMVDNQDGTVTFWREWWCRESAESNNFLPGSLLQEMGTATLPIGPRGPVGGQYLISSSNPASNVAYFWRHYQQYNEEGEFWQTIGEAEQIGGVIAPAGPQGEKGDYYALTADNPPGSTSEVRLYRQLKDGQTGVPLGSVEQIGSATAIQGPPGPQGLQGPPGSIAGGSVSSAVFEADEFLRHGWICRKLAEMIAAEVEATARSMSLGLSIAGSGIGLLGVAAGIIATGGVGLVLAGLGIGIAQVFTALSDADLQLHMEPFRTEAGVDSIAKDLYCSLMTARYLDPASIAAWVGNHQGGDAKSLILAGEPEAATRAILAQTWANWTYDQIIQVVAVMLIQYEYNPLFDYRSLPCTPNLGPQQRVDDFLTGQHGWINWANPGYGLGEWVNGAGWLGEVRAQDNNGSAIGLEINFPDPVTITYIEFLYDLDAITGPAGVSFPENIASQYTTPTVGVNQVYSRTDPSGWTGTKFVLWFSSWTPGANLVLKRASFTYQEAS